MTGSSRDAFLQSRLAAFGIWGCGALAVGQLVRLLLGAVFQDMPTAADFGGQSVATVALFLLWAAARANRQLPKPALVALDVVTMNVATIGFCVMASDLPLVAHPSMVVLLALAFTFSMRATYVPSSTRQTLLVHTSAGIWLALSAAHMAVRYEQADATVSDASLRGQLITAGVWWGFITGAATAATSVIYGLRKEVQEAMQLGQYTLEAKIGEGGMGAVYHARHALLRRPTAIKLLPPDRRGDQSIARFEREVQRTAALSHPNVVTVFDYGRTPDGIFYYAMEHLNGFDLAELVSRYGPLDPARAIHLLIQVCEGLAAAHEVGLIHRDIKPGNILILRGGRTADLVKLVDFGLLKEMGGDPGGTGESRVVGTPACMAPEHVEDPASVDERSDLYAVGAVAYFLLTGRHVFEAKTAVEVLAMHMSARPPRIDRDDLPEALEEIIMRCLEKDPAQRPQSASALQDLFASIDDVRRWRLEDAQAWWAQVPLAVQATKEELAPTSAEVSVDMARR